MNSISNIMTKLVGAYGAMTDRWWGHNCKMCHLVGSHRPDTKSRGGLMITSTGGVRYHCFNCRFTATWEPGMNLDKKFIRLAEAHGATPDDITKMTLYAKELQASGITYSTNSTRVYTNVQPKPLPEDAHSLNYWAGQDNIPSDFLVALTNIADRNELLLDLPLMWSPSKEHNLNTRFIIPYIMNGKPIGYTARSVYKNAKSRYHNSFPSNVLFNHDLLNNPHVKTILVFEGPIDAMLMGGVATSSQIITQYQIELLQQVQSYGKRIVVVPDRDTDGRKMATQAVQAGFDLALPEYGINNDGVLIKDPEEATEKYGRLFVRQLINNTTYSSFESKVMMNKWF